MNQHVPTVIDPESEFIVQDADVSMAIGLTRAEVDQQIATARRFPRSIKRATDKILSLMTLDEITAQECMFAVKRGDKAITGPSIRAAEIIGQCWGNNRVASRVVHVDRIEKFVEAEGVYHDLETNSACCARVRRRIVDSKGRLYSEDMIILTGNAAASIAKRNAILAGVPKPVWRKAYDVAVKLIAGDVKTLSARRESGIKAFAALGVTAEKVCEYLGVAGIEDIGIEMMPVMIGAHSALKNGEMTVEEMFRPKTAPKQALDHNPLVADKKIPAEPHHAGKAGETATHPPAAAEVSPATPDVDVPDAMEKGREAKRQGLDATPPKEWVGDAWAAQRDAFIKGHADEVVE